MIEIHLESFLKTMINHWFQFQNTILHYRSLDDPIIKMVYLRFLRPPLLSYARTEEIND